MRKTGSVPVFLLFLFVAHAAWSHGYPPTFAETGHRAVAIEAYMGVLAPAGTPRAIVDRLHGEIQAVLREKDTAERLAGAGLDLVRGSPEEYAARLKADLEKYAKLAKALAAKAE